MLHEVRLPRRRGALWLVDSFRLKLMVMQLYRKIKIACIYETVPAGTYCGEEGIDKASYS